MVAAARRFPPWSELHPELLGLVLRRLSSLADRIRLRAVCHSWRRGALLEAPLLPPPLPWLTLPDGTFLSVPDGETHRVPLPDNARLCHGSVSSWLFLSHADNGCSLMNPFSSSSMQLPKVGTVWGHQRTEGDHDRERFPIYLKMVAISPSQGAHPSPDSVFAVLITDSRLDTVISVCRPTTATAFKVPPGPLIHDIAFYDGKLYALTCSRLFLLAMDCSSSSKGSSKPTRIQSMKCIVNSTSMDDNSGTSTHQFFADKGYLCGYWGYLVESNGRLLYVRRLVGVPPIVPDDNVIRMQRARTLSFDIFEANLTTIDSIGCGQWTRVSTLRGRALFVGTHSKSLPASQCGAQEDCIYFMRDYDRGHPGPDPLRDSGVFNMKNGMITPLLAGTSSVVPPIRGEGAPAWFFPAQAL